MAASFSLDFFTEPVPVSSVSEIRYELLLNASPANVNVPPASARYRLFASGTPAVPFPVMMSFLPSRLTSIIAIACVVRTIAFLSIVISSIVSSASGVVEGAEGTEGAEVFSDSNTSVPSATSVPSVTVRSISPTNLNVPSPSLK